MPKTYPPDAVREACGLYMSGLGFEDVAREMRSRGYATYSAETIKRWASERGWDSERARLRAEEASLSASLDHERLTLEMLQGLIRMRADLETKRIDKEGDFAELVRLQLSVEAQIRQLINQRKSSVERVDKPALALEVLELMIGHLAAADPVALEALQPHIEDLGAELKEKYAEAA